MGAEWYQAPLKEYQKERVKEVEGGIYPGMKKV